MPRVNGPFPLWSSYETAPSRSRANHAARAAAPLPQLCVFQDVWTALLGSSELLRDAAFFYFGFARSRPTAAPAC